MAILMVAGGLTAASLGSHYAVNAAERLIAATRLSPFIVGLVLLAMGTDLPEIANGIAAAIGGHGDIMVGDSVGSAFTQSTLILALLVLIGGMFHVNRRETALVGGATVAALLLAASLMADGRLGRLEGAVLIAAWVLVGFLAYKALPDQLLPAGEVGGGGNRVLDSLATIGALLVVGAGAWIAVRGLVDLSDELGLSPMFVGFVVASLGTSLPELIVNATALRRGEASMAIGGLLGSSLLDSTVSLGAGPLVAPVAVTAAQAVPATLLAAGALTVVAGLLTWRARHDRVSAAVFIVLYLAMIPVLLSL